MNKKELLLILMLLPAHIVFSESVLKDPFIPDGEIIRYLVSEEDGRSVMTQKVERALEDGKDIYIISSESPDSKSTFKIIRDNMVQYYSHTINENGILRSESTRILKNLRQPSGYNLEIFEINGLVHLLRAYPFEKPGKINIKMAGYREEDDDSGFEMNASYITKEKVSTGAGDFMCYKLELDFVMTGAFSIISFLIPKTYMWYSVDKPHYLVKFEGVSGGGPDSSEMTIELIRRSIE